MPSETIQSTAAVDRAESEGGAVVKVVAKRIRALNKRIRKATDLEAKIANNPEKVVHKEEVAFYAQLLVAGSRKRMSVIKAALTYSRLLCAA